MSPAETVVTIGWPLLAVLLANVVVPHAPAGRRVQPARPGPAAHPRSGGPIRQPAAVFVRLLVATVSRVLPQGVAAKLASVPPRRVGLMAAVGLLGLLVAPTATPGIAVVAWLLVRRQNRKARQRSRDAVTRAIPELIDLIRLALDSGCTIPLAFIAIAGRYQGSLAGDLAVVARDLTEGQGTANALEGLLARVGEPVRPLCAALLAGERYGLPTAAMLDALAIEARATRRRYDEQRARRLPITMLFPLITCTLPAFALLTVVPLLASGLQAVRW